MTLVWLYGFRDCMSFPWLYGSFAWLNGFSSWLYVIAWLYNSGTLIIVLLHGYTRLPRGYIILRGYTTFAWLYASLICLFNSFACLYGFQWLYDFYMRPEVEINDLN